MSRWRSSRGVLRPARPQRRRQVDADPLHDRAGAADRRLDPGLRPRRDRRLRRGAPGGRAGAAGAQPRLVPHRRGDARLPRRLLRHAQARAARADQGAARDLLADREARRTHPHPLGRDEAAADPGAGDDAPAAPADPRRADRRRRRRAAARALALRAADQPGGDDDPAHHALPRGGRAALRPDRLHQRRPDRRRGDQRASWPSATASPTSRTPTWPWSAARSSRARTSRSRSLRERRPDPLRDALAPRGQPLHEDQEADARRAAAGNLPLHLGLRRRARLADQASCTGSTTSSSSSPA